MVSVRTRCTMVNALHRIGLHELVRYRIEQARESFIERVLFRVDRLV